MRVETLAGNKNKSRLTDTHRIAVIVCLCVFLISVSFIINKIYNYYIDNRKYEEIRAQVTSVDHSSIFDETTSKTEGVTENGSTEESKTTYIYETGTEITKLPYAVIRGDPQELDPQGTLYDYSALKIQNSDLAGWIMMPGFEKPIDYPIMFAYDYEYYLYKDFYKKYSYAGSIFMDFRNNRDQPDRNIVLYGHAMNDRSMFGNLKEFPERPEEYKNMDTIYIDLMNCRLEYRVFSIYYEDKRYNYRQTAFANDQEYYDFLQKISDRSVYDFGIELNYLDRILTLSTCNNKLGKDARSVLHAKLVKMITYDRDPETSQGNEQYLQDGKKVVTANVYLTKLGLSFVSDAGKAEKIDMEPDFSTVTKDYTAFLPDGVNNISINTRAADPDAKIVITADGMMITDGSVKFDGTDKTIQITVTSRDGQFSRNHYIKLTRRQ